MKIISLSKIKDFESISENVKYVYITEEGTLISYRNTRNNYVNIPKILKGTKNKDGYIRDDFYNKKTKEGFKITRQQLVMMAFSNYRLGDYLKGKEIDHINRNREDNRLVNLRIVDRQTNVDNSFKGKIKSRKFKREEILKIYKFRFEEKLTYEEIAKKFKTSYVTILKICKGKTYQEIHAKEITNFC